MKYEDILKGIARYIKRIRLGKESKEAFKKGDMEDYLKKEEELRNINSDKE